MSKNKIIRKSLIEDLYHHFNKKINFLTKEEKDLIENFKFNQRIDTYFIVRDVEHKRHKNRDTYFLLITLQDVTGEFVAKKWDMPYHKAKGISDEIKGKIIRISGIIREFNDSLYIEIDKDKEIEILSPDNCSVDLLKKSVKKSPDYLLEQIFLIIDNELDDDDWKKLANAIHEDDKICERLKIAPASTKFHQNYSSGLIEHIYEMLKKFLDEIKNNNLNCNKDLVIMAILTHDIGKIDSYDGLDYSYKITKKEKKWGHSLISIEIVLEKILGIENFDENKKTELIYLIENHMKNKVNYKDSVTKELNILRLLDSYNAGMSKFRL